MKNFLTFVLCWLLAFSAMAENVVKIKRAQSIAGGYVTSLNKVDGSFEDGTTGWVASVGTIVKTASTEFQGNFKGVWAATGTGTLDLQWTATASNTYEASVQFRASVADSDHYICAYVGTTETGCALIDGPDYTPNTIRKVSVVADSVMSSAFYLRLKHTGSDAFSVEVDDGKIEPYTPNVANLVEQQGYDSTTPTSATYDGTTGNFKVEFPLTKGSGSGLFVKTTVGSHSRFTLLKTQKIDFSTTIVSAAVGNSVQLYKNGAVYRNGNEAATTSDFMLGSFTDIGNAGDYYELGATDFLTTVPFTLNITATALSSNVIQSYSEDRVGETIYSIQSVAPNGFISAQGSILGLSSGTHQGEAYKALYKYAWNIATTTSTDPYYISSAKGASADADWTAGKTIKIDESGLFTRAYLAGTTGSVGVKQADAFQGHQHSFAGVAASPGSGNTLPYSAGTSYPTTNIVTDGVNGTPRIASETRPTNVAKYAYIRYAQSMPTLYALPVSKENRFEARITNTGSVLSQNVAFINSVSKGANSQYTINYAQLGLTVAPSITTTVDEGSMVLPRIISVSPTQAIIQTVNSSTLVPLDAAFTFKLSKQSPDYQAPGVFVGNVQPDWTYDISSTLSGAGLTAVNQAVATVRKTGDGRYRIDANIDISVQSAQRTTFALSSTLLSNTRYQACGGYSDGFPLTCSISGSGSFVWAHSNVTTTNYQVSGTFISNTKPTWATQTP